MPFKISTPRFLGKLPQRLAVFGLLTACSPTEPGSESDSTVVTSGTSSTGVDSGTGESSGEVYEAPSLEAPGIGEDFMDVEIEEPFVFAPHGCVNELGQRRPKIEEAEQEATKRLIRHVVERMNTKKKGAKNDSFLKLLMLVALREASFQKGLVHQLPADQWGSIAARRKMKPKYKGNSHNNDPEKWQTYGLFGMNSNYFTILWDKLADPRVLCDPIVDVLAYKRAAERARRKLGTTIRCKDADGDFYDYKDKSTWINIHRAVSRGSACPHKNEAHENEKNDYFRRRAARLRLDPDEVVTSAMLGEEPDASLDGEKWPDQEHMVMGLWGEIKKVEAELAAEEAEKANSKD